MTTCAQVQGIASLAAILRENGYEGYLSLKSVGGDFRDSLAGVRALVEGLAARIGREPAGDER